MSYEIVNNLLLHPASEWSVGHYGFDHRGKGDVLTRSAIGSLAFNNRNMLLAALDVLKQERRWPDWLDHERDASNIAQKEYSDYLNWKDPEKNPQVLYRPGKGLLAMTRDPYYYVVSALSLTPGLTHLIKDIKPPSYVYSPAFKAWLHYMKSGRGKKIYEFYAKTSLSLPGQKVFVKHMAAVAAFAAKSPSVKLKIELQAPAWNTAILALCYRGSKHPLAGNKPFLEYNYKRYKAKKGFQWSDEEVMEKGQWFTDEDYLDENDPLQLDKAWLRWILDHI